MGKHNNSHTRGVYTSVVCPCLIILIHYITVISSQTECNIVITSASTPGAMSISVGGTVVNSALFISFTENTYTFKLIAIDSSCTVISVNPLTIEDTYKLPRGTIIVGALDGPMPADTGDRDVVYQAAEQRLQPFGISASSVCDKTSDIEGSTQDADDILTFTGTIGQPEDAFLIASGTDPTDTASYTKYTDNSCISSLPSTDILGSPYDSNSVSQDSTIVISDTFTCTGTIYGWQYVPQEESDAFFAVYSESSGKYNLKDSNHVRTSSTDAINGVQYTCVSDSERISVTSGDMYGIYYDTSTLSNGPGIQTLADGSHISTMPFPCGRQPTDADLDVIVSGTFSNNTGHAPGSSETYSTAVGGALGLRPIMDPNFHLNCGCSFDSDCQAGGDSNMVCVSGTCKCYDSRIFDPTHNLCVLDMAKEQPVTTSSNATNSDPSHVNDGDVTTCHSTDPALSTASSPHVTLDLGVTTGVYAVSITTPETNTAIETGTTGISSGTGTVSISPVDDRVCVTIDGDATIQDVDEKTSGVISLTADPDLNVDYTIYDAILHDLVVYVSNSQTPYATFDAIPASDVCRYYTGVIPHNTTIYASCDNVVSGRYLHIQYTCAAEPHDQPLQICDVKVYGPEDSTLKPCTTDLECQQAGDQDLICMNLVCACRDGYRYRNRRCEDINECDEMIDNCNYNCTNTPGSYSCDCPDGMVLQPGSDNCVDLNECTQSNPCEQLCTNLENGDGYTCGCNSGYTLDDANNKTCNDINECIQNPNNCTYDQNSGATCKNEPGTFTCECRNSDLGVTWDGDNCVYVDENGVEADSLCEAQNGGCEGTCTPTVGGSFFDILCSCDDGYTDDQPGSKKCNDIDECAQGTNLCISQSGISAVCTNTPGSYYCECPVGYTWANQSCVDINECETNAALCDHQCVNLEAGYSCVCHNNTGSLDGGATCTVDNTGDTLYIKMEFDGEYSADLEDPTSEDYQNTKKAIEDAIMEEIGDKLPPGTRVEVAEFYSGSFGAIVQIRFNDSLTATDKAVLLNDIGDVLDIDRGLKLNGTFYPFVSPVRAVYFNPDGISVEFPITEMDGSSACDYFNAAGYCQNGVCEVLDGIPQCRCTDGYSGVDCSAVQTAADDLSQDEIIAVVVSSVLFTIISIGGMLICYFVCCRPKTAVPVEAEPVAEPRPYYRPYYFFPTTLFAYRQGRSYVPSPNTTPTPSQTWHLNIPTRPVSSGQRVWQTTPGTNASWGWPGQTTSNTAPANNEFNWRET